MQLLDLRLPDGVGLATLDSVVDVTEFTPVVVLTGRAVDQGGKLVRIHEAATNWNESRVSVALTGWSTIHFQHLFDKPREGVRDTSEFIQP